MDKQRAKWRKRTVRHWRVRKKIIGTAECPRLSVYRSLNHIYAQLIDDTKGQTLLNISTFTPAIKEALKTSVNSLQDKPESLSRGGNLAAAKVVGKHLGELALKKGIQSVVFDRGMYLYHGRIRALADAARKSGLKF